jgi:phospholipase C
MEAMPNIIESSYGKVFKTALKAVNPVKKMVIKTECKVHKSINTQSIIILKNDGYTDSYSFFAKYIEKLNRGVVWADQDLKSRNHFYNPDSNKGLYGCSDALKECISYYTASLTQWSKLNVDDSLFYLGASCHLIQDVTVPQHVNVKLLKKHRKYEQWVVRMHESYDRFKCYDKGIYLSNVKDFVMSNAFAAIKAYNGSINIKNIEDRFFNITDSILCQAQRSTAGLLNLFYNDIKNMGNTQ